MVVLVNTPHHVPRADNPSPVHCAKPLRHSAAGEACTIAVSSPSAVRAVTERSLIHYTSLVSVGLGRSSVHILNCGSDVIRPIVGSSFHQPEVAAISVCVHGRPYKFCTTVLLEV